jgi:hypothetical protein
VLQSMDAVKASEGLLLQDGNAADRIAGNQHKERREFVAPLGMLVSGYNQRQGGQRRRYLVLVQSSQRRYCFDRRFYRYRSHKQSQVDHGSEVKI